MVVARSSFIAGGGEPDLTNPRSILTDQIVHYHWQPDASTRENVILSGLRSLSNATAIVEDGAGDLHIVIAGATPLTQLPSMYHVRYSSGAWSPPAGLDEGFYPSLIIDDQGAAVMVYNRIGAFTPSPGDSPFSTNNPVWTYRTLDGCTGSPTLVHAGGMMAGGASITQSIDGDIHIVWPQDVTGDAFPEDIWHAHGDLSSWSHPSSVAGDLPGMAGITGFAADQGGAIHLTFGHFATRGFPPALPSTPVYARYLNGTWEAEFNPLGIVNGSIFVSVDENGRLHTLAVEANGDETIQYYVPPSDT